MLRAEFSQRFDLASGKHFGDDHVDPGLTGNSFSRTAIVARHHDNLETLLAQGRDRAPRRWRNRIGHHKQTRQSLPSIAA